MYTSQCDVPLYQCTAVRVPVCAVLFSGCADVPIERLGCLSGPI